jgi:hypothetical protein
VRGRGWSEGEEIEIGKIKEYFCSVLAHGLIRHKVLLGS